MLIMKILSTSVGQLDTQCYILCDEKNFVCAIIDPGFDSEKILRLLKSTRCVAQYIILTHGHFDHVTASNELRKITGAKVIMHECDAEMVTSPSINLYSYLYNSGFEPIVIDEYISDGYTMQLGNLKLKFIHTPGHTPGCVCIICEDVMFSGDTLFKGTIGRVDHPGGDILVSIHSVKELAKLKQNYRILPGHGGETTLDDERKNNPYMDEIY
jgi:hydroxyacylglutathione hydrolase